MGSEPFFPSEDPQDLDVDMEHRRTLQTCIEEHAHAIHVVGVGVPHQDVFLHGIEKTPGSLEAVHATHELCLLRESFFDEIPGIYFTTL